eukprot:UN05161
MKRFESVFFNLAGLLSRSQNITFFLLSKTPKVNRLSFYCFRLVRR